MRYSTYGVRLYSHLNTEAHVNSFQETQVDMFMHLYSQLFIMEQGYLFALLWVFVVLIFSSHSQTLCC